MQVFPFDKKFNRKNFYCGVYSLDHYIHHQVSHDIRKKLATCFVLLDVGLHFDPSPYEK